MSIAGPASLVDLLEVRTAQEPERPTYAFETDDGVRLELRNDALSRRARAIAAFLQDLGAEGERALLLYPPGLDYLSAFFGCLYARVIAVPAYPPNLTYLARSLSRLGNIVRNADASFVLTTSDIADARWALGDDLGRLGEPHWVATDRLPVGMEHAWRPVTAAADDVAFLQYTSGSTGDPKGVVLTHRNLLWNIDSMARCFGVTRDDRHVCWLPPYHDMGLIGGLLWPLSVGMHVTTLSPAAFLKRPRRWLEVLSQWPASVTAAPNFAYELCVRKVAPEDRAGLDLSGLRIAFNGAEPVHKGTLERFVAAFGPCGFRREAFCPVYGLAECTLIVSGGGAGVGPHSCVVRREDLQHGRPVGPAARNGSTDEIELVGCGRTLAEQEIAIVDPTTRRRCGEGEVGEIWVGGASVARGYWQAEEPTRATFEARPVGDDAASRSFCRTGDLGLLRDGELYVVGRMKDVIVIRGRNYHPEEVEAVVDGCHPGLRPGCGAVFGVDGGVGEGLVAVYEGRGREMDAGAAVAAIRRRIREQYELQVAAVVIVGPGCIPKTSSGKIQRHACRHAFLDGRFYDVIHVWQDQRPERVQ
jgi:acyl-CoA synthetase (AMP-forming)/AMP-acid ligase II